jgi:hypothetical protein
VSRRYVPLLLTLSALWGASYLFIKVGVRDLAPTVLVELRLLLAAAVLAGFLWLRDGRAGATAKLRAAVRPGIVLGLLNAAIPFVLIAWGERHIDSGVAAVANATVPIFNALLVLRFNPAERVSGMRFVGVLAGLGGRPARDRSRAGAAQAGPADEVHRYLLTAAWEPAAAEEAAVGDELVAVAAHRDDLEVRLPREQRAYALAYQQVVVGEHDPDHRTASASGNVAATR